MKAWRDWFVQNEREWSGSLTRIMKNEEVARAVGQEINASLMREQMLSQSMAGSLAKMNMPTRDDIVALSDRVGRLEDAIARVEAALVRMKEGITTAAVKPSRTRKPSKAKASQ
jgi:hypothetical protein